MNKILENVAYRQLRAKAHKRMQPLFFLQELENVKRILVCMPADLSEYGKMVETITQFRHCFPNANITLLQPQTIPVPGNLTLGFQVVIWSQNDVDRMGKPGNELKKRLFSEAYDLAVDLNISPNFFSMAVAVESEAPIRAGFSNAARADIYNFLIQPESADAGRYLPILLAYLGKADAPGKSGGRYS